MATVEINDIEVSYTESGDASSEVPPVVLVHGLAEAKESWAHTQEALSELRTVAYDLRGHGGTSAGAGEGSLEQLGGDLIEFLESVTGPAIVVGFSLGGTIALWGAAERPDLVRQAIVLGTSSLVGRGAVDFYKLRIAMAEDTSSEEFAAAIKDDTAAALTSATDQLESVTAARLAAIGGGAGYVNASTAMAALRDNPLTPRLGEVRVHVDVVGAGGDTFCPRKAADIIVEALPDVSYWEIENAGHLMNVDNPEAVTAVIRDAIAAAGTR